MLKLEKFTGTKTYMYPNGSVATPDRIRQEFEAVNYFTHVIETDGEVCFAVQNLKTLRHFHNIDESLTDNDAIAAIETIINTPPPEPEPTPEERMAAAMEFQNLLAL